MATNHVKVYLKHFGYGEQSYIPCEACTSRCVDVHHLIFRSHGGGDSIDNLMGLCRDCHEKAHNDRSFNEYLKVIHAKKLRTYENN